MNRYAAFGFALLVGSAGLHAHDDAYLAAQAAAHGGQVRMAGGYHVEAVVEGDRLVLYVTDHGDTPQSTAGWEGRATVLTEGRMARLTLTAAGENRLKSETPVAVRGDSRTVVLLQPPNGESLQLSFLPAGAGAPTATHAH